MSARSPAQWRVRVEWTSVLLVPQSSLLILLRALFPAYNVHEDGSFDRPEKEFKIDQVDNPILAVERLTLLSEDIMREIPLTFPEIGMINSTRFIIGTGVGLLLAGKIGRAHV